MTTARCLSFVVAACLAALSPAAASAAAGSGAPTISGASQALCTPSPCSAPTGATTVNLTGVSNGDGTASTRQYAVLRPHGLIPSPTNRAPAVLMFYAGQNCGYHGGGRWTELAPVDRFVVVAMEVPCGGVNNWRKRNIDSAAPAAPSDEPYVAAVVQSLEQCPASHAATNQCIDPQRVYAVGLSSGGNMTADIMCDAQNSTLFRGYLIDSSSIELWNGVPDCPSTNRSYFVMLAVSNYSIDAGLFYSTATNPHLDVPTFADWAATRLGCTGSRVDGAVGSPVASTLTYTYSAPCAYAVRGTALESLGVVNGGHGWGCQDSDPNAPPNPCPGMPNPPGVGAKGYPKTNGLFVEADFWSMMAQGISTATPAPPLSSLSTIPALVRLQGPKAGTAVQGRTTLTARVVDSVPVTSLQFQLDGRPLGGLLSATPSGAYSTLWNTLAASDGPHTLTATLHDNVGRSFTSLPLTVWVTNPLSQAVGASFEALGDDEASGLGLAPYLAGTNTPRDACRRSPLANPYLAAGLLGVPASQFGFHACAGATLRSFVSGANHEPAQLHWLGRRTHVVTIAVGWNDSSLGAALASCVLGRGCASRWTAIINQNLARLAASGGLRSLFVRVAHLAPHARVVVLGYPRLFPARPPQACNSGVRGIRLTGSAMAWVNAEIHRLDGVITAAARRAGVRYVSAAERAFSGHEWCTARPDVGGAAGRGRGRARPTALLASSFMPNSAGQTVLARLLAAQT